MPKSAPNRSHEERVEAVRAFNRFYTRRIGAVRDRYLQSNFSLTEARVLYELAQTPGLTAAQTGAALDLDAGYLSRILRRFEQDGLLVRGPSGADRRKSDLCLTDAGHAAFARLDERARNEIGAMLSTLPLSAQETLILGMSTVTRVLAGQEARTWTTRSLAPGDIGWVIERHAALYASEYQLNHRFEVLVAEVAGSFLADHDPDHERAWIAECDGVRTGSVFLVRQSADIGKLRLLLVEPSARGLGIGKGLVDICLSFARTAGYRQVTLWTNDILVAARGIYQAAGFRIVASEPHNDFGPPMVGEEWSLTF